MIFKEIKRNFPNIKEGLNENDKSHREKYLNLYEKLINRCLNMTESELSGYNERHHILPKCMGGTNEEDNLVLLPIRYHIMAHMILFEIYPEIKGISYSLLCMINGATREDPKGRKEMIERKFSSRLISLQREEARKMFRGENHPNFGRHHSKDSRMKISRSNSGKHHSESTRHKISESNKGRKISKETREKLREANLGKKASKETRLKMSLSKKGKKVSDETKKKIGESNKGKIIKPESRIKISNSLLGHPGTRFGTPSEEIRNKISKTMKGTRTGKDNPKAVEIISPEGIYYSSMIEASIAERIPINKLSNMLKKSLKDKDSLGWRYKYTDSKKLPRFKKSVISPEGILFESITEASNKTGIRRETISEWLNHNRLNNNPGWKFE